MSRFEQAAAKQLRAIAATGQPFTADDLWPRLPAVPDRDPRCLGAVFRAASDDGLIRPTGKWRESKRTACHHRPMREWVGK